MKQKIVILGKHKHRLIPSGERSEDLSKAV
jgi:hypothetical protein